MSKQEKRQVIKLESLDGWRPYKGMVLVKPVSKENATTKGGIILGFNTETQYGEGQGSHVADFAPTEGDVVLLPLIHSCGPDYYIPNELKEGDHVWFSYRGWVEGVDVIAGEQKLLLVPYSHMIAATRGEDTIMLNGYVLLEEMMEEVEPTALYVPEKVDKNRGIVRFLGGKRDYYDSRFTDEIDIQVGDIVLLKRGGHNIPMERQPYLATFDNGTMYRRVKRRDIMAVINSFVVE